LARKLSRSRIETRGSLVAALVAGVLSGIAGLANAAPVQLLSLTTNDNTNLTSLGFPAANFVDSNLINPWGISFGPATPFWVSDNNATPTGVSTLYTATGAPAGGPLVVTIGDAVTPANPTGTVFNGNTNDFFVTTPTGTGTANFLFATENGTISGRSTVFSRTRSFVEVNNSGSGAVYKGLAITTPSGSTNNVIFATNFNSGNIEEYNSNWGLMNTFADTALPPVPIGTPSGQNWAPFNIQVINGQLYVTFALQNAAKHDDVAGAGNGFVDVFDLNGNFIKRLIPSGGVLDSPWGLAIAPPEFGGFEGDLLVGNFGNGEIDAFDPATGAFLGVLEDKNGNPIDIPGLWDITVGNMGAGVDPNAIYFTAGLPNAADLPLGNEQEGLFGELFVPEPGSLALLMTGLAGLMWLGRRRRSASLPV
jgi:uncharacterized protein (TIGR03118 family)